MSLAFENPANGCVEDIKRSAIYTLLFGFMYFVVRGVWTHAIAALVLAILTLGLSWLVYPLFAKRIMRTHYLQLGWVPIENDPSPIDRFVPRASSYEGRSRPKILIMAMLGLVVIGLGLIGAKLLDERLAKASKSTGKTMGTIGLMAPQIR